MERIILLNDRQFPDAFLLAGVVPPGRGHENTICGTEDHTGCEYIQSQITGAKDRICGYRGTVSVL